MSYIDFKALVKKVNLKPKGVKEIVLEVSDTGLDGKLDRLSEMIDLKAEIQMESLTVNFNVTFNSLTDRPVIQYEVDQQGVVKKVEEKEEQLEADLGLPKEAIPTEDKEERLDREIVDEFIVTGMAPSYNDLPDDIANIVKRKIEGESYSKLASELNISSGSILDLIDGYRIRVAPLAQKWWEWKQQQGENENQVQEPSEEEATDTGKSEQDSEDDNQHGAA